MAGSMQIELDEREANELRELAGTLQQAPEKVAREIVENGMHMMRRWAYLKKRSENVDVDAVIEMLRSSKKSGDPPQPGDELPEDLRYILFEGRSERSSA